MSILQLVVGWTSTLQTFILFLLLVYRGHHRRLPLFALYAGGLTVSSTALGLQYSWQNWMNYQIVAATLRFAVALELTYAIFGAFPAAAVTARKVTFGLLVITAVTLMSVTQGDMTYTEFSTLIVPRLATGAVWIFTALAALVLWYRLPLGALQKAILMGYAPYLLIFTVAMNLLAAFGWQVRDWVGYLNTISFFALIHYWCHVAWRSSTVTTVPAGAAVASLSDMSSRERRAVRP